MSFENGGQIDSRHKQVITHIILSLYSSGSPQISRNSNTRNSRHIAVSPSVIRLHITSETHSQIRTIVPNRVREIASHCIDQHFVLVELEHDVG